MARLLLSDLIDEVRDIRASFPAEKIARAANKVIRRIYDDTSQPVYGTLTTRVKTASGTVTATQDAVLVTFSGTPLASTDPLMFIKIDGEEATFLLTYVSTSTGTLSSKWPAATASGLTYTIYYPTHTFDQPIGEVLRIWRPGCFDAPLGYIPDIGSDPAACCGVTGSPQRWAPYIHDSSATAPNDERLRILLDPVPEAREVFEFEGRARPTFLTPGGATTQAVPLPDCWNEAVIAYVVASAYEVRGDTQMALAKYGFYESLFKRTRAARLPAAVVTPGQRRRGLTAFSGRPENG